MSDITSGASGSRPPSLLDQTTHLYTAPQLSGQDRSAGLTRYFLPDAESYTEYTDNDIDEISNLLRAGGRTAWSDVPRLYIILRKIDHLQLLDDLIDQGLTDYWLPYSETSPPPLLDVAARHKFLKAQQCITTAAMILEKEGSTKHYHFRDSNAFPFEVQGNLGIGATSKVDKVFSRFSRRDYARKLFKRQRGISKSNINKFLNELQILKKIRHQHCVQLIASYTDAKYFGILMLPVADCNLNKFYAKATEASESRNILRTFFGCLSNALLYLDKERIRHRDIKPENILVKGGDVYLSDFGISLDWENLTRGTTVTDAGKTPAYCAPEVANNEPRNVSADVWSLGCVFLEMTTVLKGRSVAKLRETLQARSDRWSFHQNLPAIQDWLTELRQHGAELDNYPLDWIQCMLELNSSMRPSLEMLCQWTTEAHPALDGKSRSFCADCCIPEEAIDSDFESFSDDEYWVKDSDVQVTSSSVNDDAVKTTGVEPIGAQEAYPSDTILQLHLPSTGPTLFPTRVAQSWSTYQEDSDPVGRLKRGHEQRRPFPEAYIQPSNALQTEPGQGKAYKQSQNLATISAEPSQGAAYYSDMYSKEDLAPPSDELKKFESHPSKSRGSSFGKFLTAAPSPREQSVRCNSVGVAGPNSTSRRQSEISNSTDSKMQQPGDPRPSSIQTTTSASNLDHYSSQKRERNMFFGRFPELSAENWKTWEGLLKAVMNDTPFMTALRKYHIELFDKLHQGLPESAEPLVRQLVHSGLDLNHVAHKDKHGNSPITCVLGWSTDEKFRSLFYFMIQQGASDSNGSVYRAAASNGHLWAVTHLIKANVPKPEHWECQLFQGAVQGDVLEIVEYLDSCQIIKLGGICQFYSSDSLGHCRYTALNGACRWGSEQIFLYFMENYGTVADFSNIWNQRTPLESACKAGHTNMVRLLLYYGAPATRNQEARDDHPKKARDYLRKMNWHRRPKETRDHRLIVDPKTPLQYACENNHIEIVRLLLPSGASLSAYSSKIRTHLLYQACTKNQGEVARLLVASGASVDSISSSTGKTPLYGACELNHIEVARLLLSLGADVNKSCRIDSRRKYVETCLHAAARGGKPKLVKLLLEHGADPHEKHYMLPSSSSAGRYLEAVDIAKEAGHHEVARILREASRKQESERLDKLITP